MNLARRARGSGSGGAGAAAAEPDGWDALMASAAGKEEEEEKDTGSLAGGGRLGGAAAVAGDAAAAVPRPADGTGEGHGPSGLGGAPRSGWRCVPTGSVSSASSDAGGRWRLQ